MIKYRLLRISDFVRLHQMYDELSIKSREFFELYWVGFQHISIKWVLAQGAIFFPVVYFFKRILYFLYPYGIILSEVALDDNKIVGFGFLIIRHKKGNKYSAELGVAVSDAYQGNGIGKKIIQELISIARSEQICEIFLTTRIDNNRAHSLYASLGFQDDKILKNEVEWQGRFFDMNRMILNI